MKKIVLTSLILLLTIGMMAQNDKKAQTILNNVSTTTKSYKSIRIEFTYKMENAAKKINENYKGVLISKGDKYKLTFSGQEVICDSKTVWTYLKDANEVQINSVNSDDDSFTPTKLLTSYNKDYRPKLIKETSQIQTIELVPIKKKNFTKVLATIDRTKKMITTISIYDKNGSIYSYIVNKMEVNQSFTDSMFTFKAASHPGVDEIDMR